MLGRPYVDRIQNAFPEKADQVKKKHVGKKKRK